MTDNHKQGRVPYTSPVIKSALMAAARAVNHSRIWKRKVISSSKNIVPDKGAEKAAANPAATPHDKRSLFSSRSA